MSSPGNQIATGVFTSTSGPAATYINTGFMPKWVRTFQTGTAAMNTEWTEDMPDATALKRINEGVSAGIASAITATGITPWRVDNHPANGALTDQYGNVIKAGMRGFTIGVSCQTASLVTRWVALG